MKKIKVWFGQQSKFSKIIFIAVVILYLSFAIYRTPFYLLSQYGLGVFLGRLTGQFLGGMVPILLISAGIALFPYFLFRRVAETFKKYFDYLSVVFLILSLIFLYFSLKASHFYQIMAQ